VTFTDHAAFNYRRIVLAASRVVDTRGATGGASAPAGRIVRL
jgi:hypothetical protein